MPKLSLRSLDLTGQRVFVRVDFNVPLDKVTGAITNTQRIAAAIPTIQLILEKGGSVILASHLGRPDGQHVEKLTLRPVSEKLAELLGRPVQFLTECVGPETEAACAALQPGGVILLENLRFHIEEEGQAKRPDGTKESADPLAVANFRASLSRLGQIYVNDAFGTAHRAHSSVVGVDLPIKAAGLLMEKELQAFAAVLDKPARPLLAILGGAKIADKAKGVKIHLPVDFVIADRFAPDAQTKAASDKEGIPAGWEGLDSGPESRLLFAEVIKRAKTIIWNGPPGVFEFDAFSGSTRAMAQAIAAVTALGAITVVGGGDTATAAKKFGVINQVTHASTGGGASLELLEGKSLPGVTALNDQ